MAYRRPKVFLSYRHQEREGGADEDSYNDRHRRWVYDFADALATWNVDVIYDQRLQEMFRPITRTDPGMVSYLAEVSLLCMHVSQAFMPIITRGYLERVCDLSEELPRQSGTVTEEWELAREAFEANQIEWVPIIRQWPIPPRKLPPEPVTEMNSWDFRYVTAERDEVELLGDKLQGAYDIERPPIDLPFQDWIPLYVKWCLLLQETSHEEGLRLGINLLRVLVKSGEDLPGYPYVDDWTCDFERPKRFLAHCAELKAEGTFKETGIEADADGLSRFLEQGGAETIYRDTPDPEDPAVTRALEKQASELLQNVFRSHLDKTKRTLSFEDPSMPEDDLDEGLYFGETILDFSHRHPVEIEAMKREQAKASKGGFLRRWFGQGD